MPYIVNGQPVAVEHEPRNENGILWVPVRPLAEALSATVAWDQDLQQVDISHPLKGNIQLNVGTEDIIANGEPQSLQAAPFVEAAETWVPVRFFSLIMGYTLNFDLAEKLVDLTD